LTAELFSEHYGVFARTYPSSRPAIVRLRAAQRRSPASSIELEIGRLYESAKTDIERARHLLALRFYLSDLIDTRTDWWWQDSNGFTFYADLLERLGAWRSTSGEQIALVTFNYDQLLDRSAQAQVGNWRLSSMSSYVERPDWRLYKLHGSTGWARVIRAQPKGDRSDPNTLVAQASNLDLRLGELRIQPWLHADIPGEVAVPGIAVPTNLKNTFECPDHHLAAFTTDIGKTDRLLTIGWRAAEPHVIELMAAHIRPGYELAICDLGDREVGAIHANLGSAGARGRGPHAFLGGFEGLLQSDDLERWLELPIL
jgi:hypothetical protein